MAIREIEYREAGTLPPTVEALLDDLGGPALVRVPGRSSSRCRFVVTLQHGNEPSGLIACHRFLRDKVLGAGYVPRTDLYFCIVSVDLARELPLFSVRHYPGERDQNRCYLEPGGDRPGQIAADILACIHRLKPEAVIDIHNTSGQGPSFSVCKALSRHHLSLTRLFTRRIVVTDLALGALFDVDLGNTPVVTIECGGALADSSHQIAFEGIQRLAGSADILSAPPVDDFDIYLHPVRLELASGTRIAVAEENDNGADITLAPQIEKRNFGYVTPDIPLAWINRAACLRLNSGGGDAGIGDYFLIRNGQLYAAHPLKLFMVTTNTRIALSDCLLYAVKEMDHSQRLDQQ